MPDPRWLVRRSWIWSLIAIAGCGGSPGGGGTDAPTQPPPPPPPTWTLATFPGAEGFGAGADGGRGGAVIHVTTLAAVGAGSLQAALDASGPRTIVFDVSGVIDGVPILTRGDVTIAGQTSPGGVTVRGLLIQGDVVCEAPSAPDCPLPATAPEDFVVRHLRVRPGNFDSADGGGDGVRLHHAANGILDHLSIGNAADEAMQVSFTRDLTVQYTMMAETLGGHAEFGGMLINYSDPARGAPLTRLSIHHNMWNRIIGRLPELSRENVADPGVMDLELASNVYWDVERPIYLASANPQTDAALHYRLNLVGNYTAQDPSMAQCYGLLAIELGPDPSRPSFTTASSVFMADNRHNRLPDRTDYELIYNANDLCEAAGSGGLPYPDGARPVQARDVRHDFAPITYRASGDALLDLLAREVGAFPRDPMDLRLTGDVAARRFVAASASVNPAGDTLRLPFDASSPPPIPLDTDRDGMADAWERAAALDPDDPSDRNAVTLSEGRLGVAGYTNLEVYLHELSEDRLGR